MLRCRPALLAFVLLVPFSARAQEATSGITVPVTLSGGAGYTNGIEHAEIDGAFRAVVSPTLSLGPHWFAYTALETRSSSSLGYGYGTDEDGPVRFSPLQAYVGYRTDGNGSSFLFKAGQLTSAFGLGPVEYDDARMPLVGPPPVYESHLPLRADQLPCGVRDLLWQSYGSEVKLHCGGSADESYGLAPVTLYGLLGAEAEVSWNRVDARLQITNSSPANPQPLLSNSQFVQWTAGGGYTLRGGVHIGVSGFRGPYLDHIVADLLPAGKNIRDFPASGIGTDVQWSGGSWSGQGEWQHFHFAMPKFTNSPSVTGAYLQVKKIVTPRVFVALRTTAQDTGRVADRSGRTADRIRAPENIQEIGVGYRLNREQLIKIGLDWAINRAWSAGRESWPDMHAYGVQVQLVTSLSGFSKAFR
ncbi:MAG TPA: hypothetical protein VH601_26045 [Bryobacteraceae bacterium]|jgi:hypothetical protein